jgi:hypothetical protein
MDLTLVEGQSKNAAKRTSSILPLWHSKNETPCVSGNGEDRADMCIDYVKHIAANDAFQFGHCSLNFFSSSTLL